jgi:hypothetical protein
LGFALHSDAGYDFLYPDSFRMPFGLRPATATALLALAGAVPLFAAEAELSGPLRVWASNPRYFADANGRPVYLTGSHTWNSLQDYAYAEKPAPPPFDFEAYLAFLRERHLNFFRLFLWESPVNRSALSSTTYYRPVAYMRRGPGRAADGLAKFDLSRFDETFFGRMRDRVAAAQRAGVYVSVMLFEGFSITGKGNDGGDPWSAHPFNSLNNVNGIDAGAGNSVHTLKDAAVTAYQEAYVRKVVDTVNGFDNVLYEITNEDTGSPEDTAWQYHMIRFVRDYERTKAKRHPVGMTVQWPNGSDEVLLASPADWISPGDRLPRNDGRKVIINDTDHSFYWVALREQGIEAQRTWVWENLANGNQCLFMDPYLDPSHDPGRNAPDGYRPDPYWEPLRRAMGLARLQALKLNLAGMLPHPGLSSTAFCLAEPGREYFAIQPKGGASFTLDLTAARSALTAEWFDITREATVPGEPVSGGSVQRLRAPFAGPATIHLVTARH